MREQLPLIIQFLLTGIVSGLVGATVMMLFMHLVTRSGITNANMVQAIGSALTKSLDNATVVGTIIHLIVGIVFAMLYTIAFAFFGVTGTFFLALTGIAIGFFHGVVVSILLVISVAEHHPMEKFRQAGGMVAGAHLFGHLVYGASVGTVVGLARLLTS